MIDFVEYVVSELKSKRLSKTDALALIKQFSSQSSAGARTFNIHPLLHINTSDLSRQRYKTTLTGEEFFLKDHQVRDQKILPAVAYLEMARAAVRAAVPDEHGSTILELHNVVWAQPVVVSHQKEITITLFSNDGGIGSNAQIDFEISSFDAEKEVIHCQGQAVLIETPALSKVDIAQLQERMAGGKLDASDVYAVFKRMGVNFGPSHQAIKTIFQGNKQVFSVLCLPTAVESSQNEYLLHPSLMDSALQSTIGLFGDIHKLDVQPSLPFALESLRVVSPCSKEMFAWVRYSQGSEPEDRLEKFDVDLYDREGNICVQMKGYSSRVVVADIGAAKAQDNQFGTLLATPTWKPAEIELSTGSPLIFAQQQIVLYGMQNANAGKIESLLLNSKCHPVQIINGGNVSDRYSAFARDCFEKLQSIMKSKPQGKVLIQVVICNEEEPVFGGVAGLLRTATLENPNLLGQIIFTDGQITEDELAEKLLHDQCRPQDTIIQYKDGARNVLCWQAISESHRKPAIAFKDRGVYVITGGLGGLGVLFAKEILQEAANSRVILTGRSSLADLKEKQSVLLELTSIRNDVEYYQLDIDNPKAVNEFIAAIMQAYKHINGILHCAGMTADSYILKKSNDEFNQVLEPKVAGTFNLDQASQHIDLDFFVLFSSVASSFGNVGQADYAAANGFMDQFAGYRNNLVAAKQRHGKTLAINWPLWLEGAMRPDQATQELLRQTAGMHPMETATGMQALYRCLELPYNQILVMEGNLPQLKSLVADEKMQSGILLPFQAQGVTATNGHSETNANSLLEEIQVYLIREFSVVLKLPSHRIDAKAPLEKYGIDSILSMNVTNQLEKTFGSLPKTLFFEYQTIHELAGYFIKYQPDRLSTLFAKKDSKDSQASAGDTGSKSEIQTRPNPARRFAHQRHVEVASTNAINTEAIAIIGLSGRYPESVNLQEYWNNLRDGKDCIVEIPEERWNWREYYSEDHEKDGHHSSKWGGFISGVDEFDPRFFNISPREAEFIDPQERLFLQHAWMAVEDAGYNRASLQIPHAHGLAGQVGVYVGVMYSEYQLFGIEASMRGKRMSVPGSYASIANRVSYVLNLHGPSMTLDTMCSSSLAAIHLACQDLKLGRTHLAIAGGVNVSIHPNKYLFLSAGQFVSTDGHCQSFGEGGDGYIPGEGVGVVVLKRLSEAVRDGNQIYGVIKGSALNHGGKTNGYSVPNPNAQTSVISMALAESNTDPRHISYIEAHGTGTKLGDPIEIAALTKAFQQHTQDTGFCSLGSAKSNIGHCESAAGIAGLTKVLLQMKYQQIVPSLHSKVLNPHINFQQTPFVVNQTLRPWDQPEIDGQKLPRIAGISAFGAGGSNAHLLVEEYIPSTNAKRPTTVEPNTQCIIPMSARTAAQLKQKAIDLLDFIHTSQPDLVATAYTLQLGREAMEERLGFIVDTIDHLAEKLQAYINGEQDIENVFQGQMKHHKGLLSSITADADFEDTLSKWISRKKLSKVLELWVNGVDLDWNKLYGDVKPPRISLPTYPFAKERYWIDSKAAKTLLSPQSVSQKPRSMQLSSPRETNTVAVTTKPQKIQLVDAPLEEAAFANHIAFKPQTVELSTFQETFTTENIIPSKQFDISGRASAVANDSSTKRNKQDSNESVEPLTQSNRQRSIYSKEQLQEHLRTSLAEALYLNSSEIDIDKPFVDLGLDSIVGVEWIKVINKKYRLEISATRVYDYATVRSLALFLEKEIEKLHGSSRQVPINRSSPDLFESNATLIARGTIAVANSNKDDLPLQEPESDINQEQLQEQLTRSLAEALYLDPSEIDMDKPFIDLGLDSIVGVEWTKVINKKLGLEVSATKVYDYSTIRAFASFLHKELGKLSGSSARQRLSKSLISSGKQESSTSARENTFYESSSIPDLKRKHHVKQDAPSRHTCSDKKIAIIGMSGRYPQANNLQQYWDNLAQGKNSVTEIPSSRWDINRYYDPDPTKEGKMYCKWLGMLDDVDCFDPLFFQITPAEAESMDPQHRIFLQESYKAFEDAGYSNATLSNTKCGVYLGIMSNDYSFHLSKSKSTSVNITGNSFAIGAARLAYFLNLKGPAIPIDTACSSSLVAVHLACQALSNHEIDMALAGGSSLYLIPEGYVGMCQAGMLSPQGQCKTFDDSANGFVPGEGVGSLVLKRLEDAERDNDFIYGVILGSGINQDGKTNGITAPSVNSQIELERDLYTRYNIDPETISYVETHGTGTKLGDPIELEALATVFREQTSKKNFCALGSVKSNIGHTSGAAGVASIQKVLLCMQHKTLVPTLNVTRENSIFDFKNSPFYISREKHSWKTDAGGPLRRASVSSFGFSGTNAHLVIEEYPQPAKNKPPVSFKTQDAGVIIPLSARTAEQLKQRAHDLLDFIYENEHSIDLIDMAYTLQVGREQMKERLGFVVNSVEQLTEKLHAYVGGRQDVGGVYRGQPSRDKDAFSMFNGHADFQEVIGQCISEKQLPKLVELWVKGLELDWNKLYGHTKPQRISLPTYPFAKERYWIDLPMDTPSVSEESVDEIKIEVAQEIGEGIQKMHYCPIWKETALSGLSESAEKSLVDGPILIVDTTDRLYRAVKKKLEKSIDGDSVILVKLENSYQEIEPTIFTINPQQEEHFVQLIENLQTKGQLPRKIIHQGLSHEHFGKKEQVVQELSYGFYTLFYLCKALLNEKYQRHVQILSLFSSNSHTPAPQKEALGGFFKSLTLENPKYLAKVIEIKSDLENPDISTAEKARIILNEFKDENWNKNEIRYEFQKSKQTYIRRVRELTLCSNIENKANELPLKQNGVYIISGGLGGLGLIFSEYLLKRFQCKLVLFGRSALNVEQKEKLRSFNNEIIYVQADVSKLEDVELVVKTAKSRFSQINGVIHSAGINSDSFILRKTKEDIDKVLKPKIYGAINLDYATRGEKLDAFILFSSIAGVMGNLGQCDYAYANHFLDAFAENRQTLTKEQKRFGKTLSINWPYWQDGGMIVSHDEIAIAKEQFGLFPLPTEVGIQFWEEFLQSGLSQGVALYGLHSRIKAYVAQESVNIDKNRPLVTSTIDPAILLEKTEAYLKAVIGKEIKLASERIDSLERFEAFGIDSIVISRINVSLEKDLGALSKTLFYEYSTIQDLAVYLAQEARQTLIQLFNLEYSVSESDSQVCEESTVRINEADQIQDIHEQSEQIAIIGVHGHYPQSEDLNKYWENLKQGKDLVDLVPASRWNYEELYHQDPEKAAEGKIYCKWGGFISDVDKFDPAFFNITPEEARVMDPQERLFLESVWATIEDAGYTKESLKKRHPKAKSADVGVFVGVTTNSYNLLEPQEWRRGKSVPGAHPWSIANRVSYFFDFQGPSMPVDTACSSSLVAIHLACESLKKGECQVAIAGGVNLYLHPSKYHSLCKSRMVSLGGKCHSYGAGDDGFVPGEGVGSILLKPLSKALQDQDHIYGVIAGSAFDHGGRSNGYSAPNPNSQANLISHTLSKANINPETIGYIEGHGTGTQLGDSLEIVALTNAFRKQTKKKQFCPVGSVKANIGHSEAAAGIAGVAKILLQIKYRKLVPTIHSEVLNPNIEFAESPFYLQHELSQWESSPDHPRRALMNSFGAGGVNACIVLEEYEKPKVMVESKEGPCLVILSAKNEECLREYVNRLLSYIGKEKNVNLPNLSYTLQVGREAMQERLAIVVSNRLELIDRLKDWKERKPSVNMYQGSLDPRQPGKKSLKKDEEDLLRSVFVTRDLIKLAKMWIAGSEVDWGKLYSQNIPSRIALPTYPFAKERYWVSDASTQENSTASGRKNDHLHPLISYNSSTLREVSFSSLLSASEFYAQDHLVHGEKIFPGSGFLEIAGISGNIAGEQKVCKIKDIVWIHPLSFKKGSQLVQTFLKPNGNGTEYQIASHDDENERVIHSEGRLFFQNGKHHSGVGEKSVPIKTLKEKCSKSQNGAHFYGLLRKAGFNYGPAFQTIQEFYIHDSYALSKLKIADYLETDFDQFILHPSLIDGALQTVAGLISGIEPTRPYLPFAIDEVEIIRPLPQTCYAYVEYSDSEKQKQKDVKTFNIQLLNEDGAVLVRLKHFYARALERI